MVLNVPAPGVPFFGYTVAVLHETYFKVLISNKYLLKYWGLTNAYTFGRNLCFFKTGVLKPIRVL